MADFYPIACSSRLAESAFVVSPVFSLTFWRLPSRASLKGAGHTCIATTRSHTTIQPRYAGATAIGAGCHVNFCGSSRGRGRGRRGWPLFLEHNGCGNRHAIGMERKRQL